ncbi:outer membrane protein [Legionella yabuuchiae]|uniref:outer membrane protein n=1 Tax=Legionella yabuuchiae TaxID=376727 RepID=UPI001054B2D4|nr:porin family protein [Legionella yabuuchiae]
MLKKRITILALTAPLSLFAGTVGSEIPSNSWFGEVGTKYSWAVKPGGDSNPSYWSTANEKNSNTLSDGGFYSFAVGKQIHRYFDISLNYLNNEAYNYLVDQSYSSATASTSNARHRYFNLNNHAILLNAFLHPSERYFTVTSVSLTPFIGAGIGYARNNLTDSYAAKTPSYRDATTSSTSPDLNKNAFAWQGSLGLNVNPALDHLSFDIGYRYFDGGKFDGPSTMSGITTSYQDSSAWTGRLKANQLFVNFKYTA